MGKGMEPSIGLELVSVDQLGKMVHKSSASIRSDASRNPGALPPICRLPGNKRLLWRLEDVLEWIAAYVQRESLVSPYPVAAAAVREPRKRGRPRNTVKGI